MRGFFSVELLLVSFLLPYLIFLGEDEKLRVMRETEFLAQDVAEALVAGIPVNEAPAEGIRIWVDGRELRECEYDFRYCTGRYYGGGEHSICAAACSR